MKTINLAILFIGILIFSSCNSLKQKSEESTGDRLLRLVRAELPRGWTAEYDKEYAWLGISRDEDVLCVSAAPNSDMFKEPERENFTFAFRLVEPVSPKEYFRLRDENAQIQKNATKLYEELISKRVNHKFDSFLPRNNEERVLVVQYEALKKSLHTLPEFYFDDISLWWAFNSPNNPTIRILEDSVLDECTKIQTKIVQLLSEYEKAEQDAALDG